MTYARVINQMAAGTYKKEMIGTRYRHFKGGIYLVTDIAVHSETAELMVVYRTFNDMSKVWVRPLSMFLSDVDREKYPKAAQKMRFEPVVEHEEGDATHEIQE